MLEDCCVLCRGKKDYVNSDTALEEQQQNVGRLLFFYPEKKDGMNMTQHQKSNGMLEDCRPLG
jgi:hypothetical protein